MTTLFDEVVTKILSVLGVESRSESIRQAASVIQNYACCLHY